MKIWLQFPIVLLLFSCILLSVLCPVESRPARADSPETAIIKVHSRPAKDLLPQVQTILSASGRASIDIITNSVIVSDTTDTIQKIRHLIRQLDAPTPQVTITLRYHQPSTKTRSLSTSSGISGPKRGLHITSGEFHRDKSLQIAVSSGSTGYLMVGRQIPFTSFWLDLCFRYGYRFSWLNDYKTVGSSLEIRPLVLGDRVDLTIVPRLSFGGRRQIRFTEAATRITVPTDTWVQLAAANGDMDTVWAAIRSLNGQSNNRAMVLELKARVR